VGEKEVASGMICLSDERHGSAGSGDLGSELCECDGSKRALLQRIGKWRWRMFVSGKYDKVTVSTTFQAAVVEHRKQKQKKGSEGFCIKE
jgi:hypothetical protein